MDLSTNIVQQQKLLITIEMQLRIKLLQLTNTELQNFVEKEIEENPVVEIEEISYDDKDFTSDYEDKDRFNSAINPIDYFAPDYRNNKTLKEYLYEELLDVDTDAFTKTLCEYIIENIDEKGYLEIDIQTMSREIQASEEQLKKALDIIQSFEPLGVGARNLKECLRLQLLGRGYKDETLYRMVDSYLEAIADSRFEFLSKELKISNKKCQELIDIIKTLEPKPSRGFYSGENNNYIVPDAYIEKIDGEECIIINRGKIPVITVNKLYNKIDKVNNDANFREYIKERYSRANFIIRGIEQRNVTLKRVIEEIVRYQKDFFYDNNSTIIPMTLKDIAEKLNLHISTISRAVNNKFVICDRGCIKLKDMFTQGFSDNKDGEQISSSSIKDEIVKIIKEEDTKRPISDENITGLLNSKGMNISRRTVAKYREELGIRSSSKRKRY